MGGGPQIGGKIVIGHAVVAVVGGGDLLDFRLASLGGTAGFPLWEPSTSFALLDKPAVAPQVRRC
jgi:hypothetical protein